MARDGGGFNSLRSWAEANIPVIGPLFQIVLDTMPIIFLLRGGGSFDPFWRSLALKLESYSIYWTQRVAGLIPYEDKLKRIFQLLFPYDKNLSYYAHHCTAQKGCSFDPWWRWVGNPPTPAISRGSASETKSSWDPFMMNHFSSFSWMLSLSFTTEAANKQSSRVQAFQRSLQTIYFLGFRKSR